VRWGGCHWTSARPALGIPRCMVVDSGDGVVGRAGLTRWREKKLLPDVAETQWGRSATSFRNGFHSSTRVLGRAGSSRLSQVFRPQSSDTLRLKGKRSLRTGVNTGANGASTLKRATGPRALQRPFPVRPVLQGGAVAQSVNRGALWEGSCGLRRGLD